MKQILIVERLFDGESFHKNMAVTIDAGKITAVIRAEDGRYLMLSLVPSVLKLLAVLMHDLGPQVSYPH